MNSACEGLYFGVPLVLFPQTPEQDAVARRTEELGAGLRLPSIREEDILNAVQKVIEDKRYQAAAGRISDSFKRSGGIGEAVAFIENVAAESCKSAL